MIIITPAKPEAYPEWKLRDEKSCKQPEWVENHSAKYQKSRLDTEAHGMKF
ncbi:hypothetical protein [Rhizobium leguminosarum]|uniref:hypothetical protein n=1 Tax=Rhizobium leguminosarum TaxID=384 RepID=UPI0013EE8ABC|nr:hypothetical protein [Rhizobium leguminosarum]